METTKEKSFRFPKKLDSIVWPRFLRKLFDLAYRNHCTKGWTITQEKIGGGLCYRTDLEFEKTLPLLGCLSSHGFEVDKISLYVEQFEYEPRTLNLKELFERIPRAVIFVTCRHDFCEKYLERITKKCAETGKLLIPIEFWETQEINKDVRKGKVDWLNSMLSDKAHSILGI